MNKLTIIGDVHGYYERYHKIISQKERHPYTVQLGDFGFNYDTLKNVDPEHHVFIGGNHDNYDKVLSVPNYLGDFGHMINFNGIDFFYYRGAWSIDRNYRIIGINWWENEQNTMETFEKAKKLYSDIRPDTVMTHDCPLFIVPDLLPVGSKVYENLTSWALQELFNIHKPKYWFFGHYHTSWNKNIDGTEFRCLNELEYYSIK